MPPATAEMRLKAVLGRPMCCMTRALPEYVRSELGTYRIGSSVNDNDVSKFSHTNPL
jgi:hypothetical protein